MNFSTILKGFKMSAKYGGKLAVKHLPGILTTVGTAGIIGAIILTAKKAPDAKKELDEEKEKWEAIPDKENRVKADYIFKRIRIGAKHYWIVAIVAGGAITCFWLANHISFKRLMSALTAAGLSAKTKEELEEKIKELDGDKHLKKVKDEIAKDKLREAPDIDPNKDYGPGESWFYEPGSRQYFRSNYEQIRQAVNEVRKSLKRQIIDGNRYAFVAASELLMDIGAESCEFGDDLGFAIEIDESRTITEGMLEEMVEDACRLNFTSDFKNGIPVGVIMYDCPLKHSGMYNLYK